MIETIQLNSVDVQCHFQPDVTPFSQMKYISSQKQMESKKQAKMFLWITFDVRNKKKNDNWFSPCIKEKIIHDNEQNKSMIIEMDWSILFIYFLYTRQKMKDFL